MGDVTTEVERKETGSRGENGLEGGDKDKGEMCADSSSVLVWH